MGFCFPLLNIETRVAYAALFVQSRGYKSELMNSILWCFKSIDWKLGIWMTKIGILYISKKNNRFWPIVMQGYPLLAFCNN